MRQTAQWLGTAMAGLAGVLVASLKLSDISKLTGQRLFLAALGVALGLVGSLSAMLAWVRVLGPVTMTLAEVTLDDDQDAPASGWLSGFASLADLRKAYNDHSARRVASYESMTVAAKAGDQKKFDQAKSEHDAATNGLELVNPAVGRVLDLAAAAEIRKRWRQALRWFILSALVAAAGTFLYAVQHPAAEAARVVAQQPVRVTIQFTSDGVESFKARLGSGCDLSNVGGVALSTDSRATAVVVTDPACSVRVLTLTPDEADIRSAEPAIKGP